MKSEKANFMGFYSFDSWKLQNNIKQKVSQNNQYNHEYQLVHCTWVYNGTYYILGGDIPEIQNQLQIQQKSSSSVDKAKNKDIGFVYCMDIQSKKWSKKYLKQKQTLQLQSNPLNNKRAITSLRSIPEKPAINRISDYQNQAYCQNQKYVYFYGGYHKVTLQPCDILWRINLQNNELSELEQKGDALSYRLNATLVSYDNQWLVLYGGFNHQQMKIHTDFFFYNFQEKSWFKSHNTTQTMMAPRLSHSMQINKLTKKIYLFSGYYFDSNQNYQYAEDAYEFQVADLSSIIQNFKEGKKERPKVQVRPISSQKVPKGRQGHKLFYINKDCLLLIGGQRKINKLRQSKLTILDELQQSIQKKQLLYDIWIFQMNSKQWHQIPSEDNIEIIGNSYFSISSIQLKKAQQLKKQPNIFQFIIFGGSLFQDQSDKASLPSSITLFSLRLSDDNLNFKKDFHKYCKKCTESQSLHIPTARFSSNYIDKILLSGMPFCFNAFGLILSNSVTLEARRVNIYYNEIKQFSHIKFQDDTICPFTAQELQRKFYSWSSFSQESFNTSQKKLKSNAHREKCLIQFCNNIKLGGLRIGENLLWISKNQTEILIFCVQKIKYDESSQNRQNENGVYESYYKLYFYALNSTNLKLLSRYSPSIQNEVERIYDKHIQSLISKKKFKTTLLITSLRKTIRYNDNGSTFEGYQITPAVLNNDLINYQSFAKKQFGLNQAEILKQSIDLSLKAYISALYLNCNTKFYINVKREQYEEIQQKTTLIKIDSLVNQKKVIEVNLDMFVQFDCKIIEVYYKPRETRQAWSSKQQIKQGDQIKQNFFSNGLLIYHHGKLLGRYKQDLGKLFLPQVSKYIASKSSKDSKYIKSNRFGLFGYIQISQKVPVNTFQNGYIYPEMMQALYSKLQQINQTFLKLCIKQQDKKYQELKKIKQLNREKLNNNSIIAQ